jgi:ABC-type sulfate transport system substrate-binding protein
MAKYYVNKVAQSNGDHEVHKEGCSFMPSTENKKYLGDFSNCKDAVDEAKKTYPQSNGCYYCSNECHEQ